MTAGAQSNAPTDGVSATARTWAAHGEAITTGVCAAFVLGGWLAMRSNAPAWASAAIFLVAYAVGGYRQAVEGVTTLVRQRELDVDLLMVVAAIGAAAIGFWSDGALLILIFALSGTLEGYASARTKRDIEALFALHPEDATLLVDGKESVVHAASLVTGDRIVVRPGERIAVDGVVVEGTSTVDQATITGESIPVDKREGDEVFAGTINGHGALIVRSSRDADATVLARIIELVKKAEERRPPAQMFIERFEKQYAKVVVAGAVLLTLVPPIVLGWTFRASLYRSMIFLVVASPCALAAAMMPTLLSALSNGARNGVLFKGSVFIEALGRVVAVAFDKTGTLTTGKPRVTDVVAFGRSDDEGGGEGALLAMAAAVESSSEHPLGRAVVEEARRRGLVVPAVTGHQSIPGRGAYADIDGVRWRIGKPEMCDVVSTEIVLAREELEREGKTVVVVGTDQALGLIAMRDTIRPEARAAIASLRTLGVKHVVMITGDAKVTAEAIAKDAGIDEVRAELLPEDKVHVVEDLVRRFVHVAMIGDGVNDAPALAVATVGVAMGSAGTDVALETADVVLTGDDLTKLPYAIELGRRALWVVKQNLVVALSVIITLVIADLLGRINLPTGVVGHEGSTLLVTLNGLRLLRANRPRVVTKPAA